MGHTQERILGYYQGFPQQHFIPRKMEEHIKKFKKREKSTFELH